MYFYLVGNWHCGFRSHGCSRGNSGAQAGRVAVWTANLLFHSLSIRVAKRLIDAMVPMASGAATFRVCATHPTSGFDSKLSGAQREPLVTYRREWKRLLILVRLSLSRHH